MSGAATEAPPDASLTEEEALAELRAVEQRVAERAPLALSTVSASQPPTQRARPKRRPHPARRALRATPPAMRGRSGLQAPKTGGARALTRPTCFSRNAQLLGFDDSLRAVLAASAWDEAAASAALAAPGFAAASGLCVAATRRAQGALSFSDDCGARAPWPPQSA